MSVTRYDFDCYAFYDSARLNVQECDDGDYVLYSDYAALEAHVARLEGFVKFIADRHYADGLSKAMIIEKARRALEEK